MLQYCTTEWGYMSHGEDGAEMYRWVGGHLWGPRRKPDTYEKPLRELWWPIESRDRYGKEEILGYYYSQPKPKILLDKPKHFAIHIRRGDMIELSNLTSYINDEQNVEAIMKIKELYSEDFSRIHILSDGTEEDLKNLLEVLKAEGIEYKLHLKK